MNYRSKLLEGRRGAAFNARSSNALVAAASARSQSRQRWFVSSACVRMHSVFHHVVKQPFSVKRDRKIERDESDPNRRRAGRLGGNARPAVTQREASRVRWGLPARPAGLSAFLTAGI